MNKKPFVSVVIPAYNEEENIASCLRALSAQDYDGPYEIIVVDNASSDATAAIAAARGVRVIAEPAKGYVRALIAGFAAAKGDIIACTDADSIVPFDWLTRIVTDLLRPGVVAVTGVFTFLDGPVALRVAGLLFGKLNWGLAGANMAMWAWAFRKVGGFSPRVNMGADKELGLRLKRVGRVLVDRTLTVATSSRRFEAAFFKTLVTYVGNDLSLILFRKPAFFNFDDIRVRRGIHYVRHPVFRFAALIVLSLSFLWYTERADNQLFGSIFAHGPQTRRVAALTFDDGPGPSTMALLDTLDAYNVKATFFLIGKNVEQYPEIAREILRRGHEIGNHTYSHQLLTAIKTPYRIKREILEGGTAIEKATGQCPHLFRPPCGWRSPWMMKLINDLGYTVVTWDVDPHDWQHPASPVIVNRVARAVRPGSIILLHDGLRTMKNPNVGSTLAAVPAIIRDLRQRGFELVTVTDLIILRPVTIAAEANVEEQANVEARQPIVRRWP